MATTYSTGRFTAGILSAALFGMTATQAVAEENFDLLPRTPAFEFNSEDTFYTTRRYSKKFRIKGLKLSEHVYFGEAKIAGKSGPGLVVEGEGYSWGFNHRGAEVLIRF